MKQTKVVHCKKEPYDVYIGRPSKWGNPFVLTKESDREIIIEKYMSYLEQQIRNKKLDPRELRGKILGCYCAPKLCHGDVLAIIADYKECENEK